MKCYLFVRHQKNTDAGAKEPSIQQVAETVASKCEVLWNKATIPTIGHKRLVKKIRKNNKKYQNMLKPFKKRKGDQKYQTKLKSYAAECNSQLFDIAACKCYNEATCTCEREKKVPLVERTFLTDQRTMRLMIIVGINTALTRQLAKREMKKRRYETYIKLNTVTSSEACVSSKGFCATQSSIDDPETSNDKDSVISSDISQGTDLYQDDKQLPDNLETGVKQCERNMKSQMQLELRTVARECDRHGVSDRCAASLVTAVLQDVGMVNKNDSSMVIDRSKIRRERKRVRKELQSELPDSVSALYFDGRKDRTRVNVKQGKKYYAKTITEEHVTLVQEPKSVYLGHITPSSGCSKTIANDINDFHHNRNINTDDLRAVGCDGTNVNTGAVGGVIRIMELKLRRPLQWLICLLHTKELPLRHLMQKLDGGTQGPDVFSGIIGKALKTCEQLPVVQFCAIMFENCLSLDGADLSTDQQYMYDMCQAISTGQCSPDLALRKPGPIVHSRWLTTANRLLRLYGATEYPSEILQTLVMYVIKVQCAATAHVIFRN